MAIYLIKDDFAISQATKNFKQFDWCCNLYFLPKWRNFTRYGHTGFKPYSDLSQSAVKTQWWSVLWMDRNFSMSLQCKHPFKVATKLVFSEITFMIGMTEPSFTPNFMLLGATRPWKIIRNMLTVSAINRQWDIWMSSHFLH